MRIGIVTTWFERGAAYVSRQYRDLLRRQGHEVSIYARGGERYATGDPNWDTPEVTWGKEPAVIADTAMNKQDFLDWISANSPELIIFNEQWWLPPVLWARDAGCKTVAYVDYYTEKTVPLFAVYDGLICNTKRHFSVFSWHFNCLYIPWGTDIGVFQPKQDVLESRRGPVFFHSAGLSPRRKGTDFVLKAFATLKGECSLIVHMQEGAFDSIPEIHSLAGELTSKGALQIYSEEVPAPGLYSLGDVYVYPSRLDGIGLTQAEALACGLPLIVPDNPPMNEFISPESGFAVPIEKLWARADGYYWPQCQVNLEALTHTMQTFIDEFDSLAASKKAARAYAERYLDWFRNGEGLGEWLLALPRNDVSGDLLEFVRQEEASARAVTYRRLRRFPMLWKTVLSTRNWLRHNC